MRDLLEPPSKEQVACQAPKPILLDTGAMDFPYPWEPKIMPLQLLQLGQFIIIAVPGEFTSVQTRVYMHTLLPSVYCGMSILLQY